MKSFVIRINEFFKLDTGKSEDINFCSEKRSLLIPLYQREYKWTKDKIELLLSDIKCKSKFLGNIILDEKDNNYEIVDGQQRITTILLVLVCIYNKYKGYIEDQQEVLEVIKPYGDVILKNDSIKEFVSFSNDLINIQVNEDQDIYKQSEAFKTAYRIIEESFSDDTFNKTKDLKEKLLDCKVLVLINDEHEQSHPVEQLFLDINEKSQQLDVEDVFKGHCFQNCYESHVMKLKEKWVKFKKYAMNFNCFGIKTVSAYIYFYILEMYDVKINEKLAINGQHILENKSLNETFDLLVQMTNYAQTNIEFFDNIHKNDYTFNDVCADIKKYLNTKEYMIIKEMCLEMLSSKKAIYQKFALMTFVNYLSSSAELVETMEYNNFKIIITNLYIYMNLFVLSSQKKSKNSIDYTIKSALVKGEKEIVNNSKLLRNKHIENFDMNSINSKKDLFFIYSIIDNYVKEKNWIKLIYSDIKGFNLEHFIVNDNNQVEWISSGSVDFIKKLVNSEKLGKEEKGVKIFSKEDVALMKQYKQKIINYLIVDKTLNELLKSYDIFTKIAMIKYWYERRNEIIPNSIKLYVDFLEKNEKYKELKALKDVEKNELIIRKKYLSFLKSIFEENEEVLLSDITNRFRESIV